MTQERPQGLFGRLRNLLKGMFSIWLRDSERQNPRAIYEQAINERVKQYRELKEAVAAMNAPPTEEEKQQQAEQEAMKMEAARQEIRGLTLENDKLEAEMGLLDAKTEHEIVKTDLEDDLVEIQAANAATGAEKARMAHDQNKIAAARVQVDLKKVNNDKSK